ncbi:nuclear pore complex protein DDB_G0274915-like isoform X2 [Thrips palmi]|uniref:Nuclear pore complex protein DDB_G0274915-like isoform X2 n=1 Tax=Thrips palmi TaxID=161013 RepID=A0A6P8Z155_THRPL|nr:nuclear pore complex protein DDB_G0274915-like isoform X2 [Thrips palmi]
MANVTNNTLFIASALLFVVGLLFLAYPYLTLAAITLSALGYASYINSATLLEYYAHYSSTLWPPVTVIERPATSTYGSNLISGVDLPSPIPHVPSGIETLKNRRSPVDEIVSSTPRGTPTSSHGSGSPIPLQLPMRSSVEGAVSDSRQLNFGRISTPKTSRVQGQEACQNYVETNSNQRLRHRPNSNKVQTAAGPLLSSARFNPAFDAGIFVNVNSPGFTDRLVRCANDNTANYWGQSGSSARQEKYGSVGLFPVVHLNAPSIPSLSPKNSQKAPNSSVRVRIAAPMFSEQNCRQHFHRGSNMQMRSYATRESIRRNEVAKSVLESLQEASRKRIYSQCQEVLEEDPGKKRQRKGDSALPNPNCDMYQYRHIRAPPIPSALPTNVQNEVTSQTKRGHDDPSKANEPKRQRQHGRPISTNNEISSSLSSSKTLLQQLSGNKRKADHEYSDGGREKQFKDGFSSDPAPSTSPWLQSRSCDEGKSAARTQEVVRSQKKSTPDSNQIAANVTVQRKNVATETTDHIAKPKPVTSTDSPKTSIEQHEKVETDLTSKLFRKDIASRSHPKVNLPEKKGSSWAQEPPDADERCLLQQSNSSEIDRPERFQSLLSRMCGEDVHLAKTSESAPLQTAILPLKSSNALFAADLGTNPTNPATTTISNVAELDKPATLISSPVSLATSNSELASKLQSSVTSQSNSPAVQPAISVPAPLTSLLAPVSSSSAQVSSFASVPSFGAAVSKGEAVTVHSSLDKTESTAVPPSALSVSSPPPTKPMFNFSPPTSTVLSQPVVSQSLPSMTASVTSPSTTTATSFASSIFKFSVSPIKPNSETTASQPPSAVASLLAMSSKPAAPPSQTTGFSFSPIQPNSSASIFAVGSAKDSTPVTSVESAKFSLPSEKPQFSISSGTFATQPEPQANGPTSTSNALSLPSSTTSLINTSNQAQAVVSSPNSGQKSSFGGFQFSGSSGSMFGQSAANGLPSFSFGPAPTTAANSSLEKSAADPKSASASGSITFGTVSTTAVRQTTSSAAFTFAQPIGNPSTNDSQKSPFQLGTNFGAANTNADSATNTSSAFRNPAQGLFNGFNSIANPATSAAQPSQQLNQQQSPGLFSFGNSQSQQGPSATFGAQPSSPPSIFGEGASQQPNFGATTTTGFSTHNNVSSFSASPFGSTSLGSSPFGSSQPSAVSFGGPAASNTAPAFGLSSGNPPAFGSSTVPAAAPSFGSTSIPSFGVTAEPAFGSTTSAAPAANITSAFNFGASSDKPAVSAFSFGASSTSAAPAFGFGSNEQQHQSNGGAPFQFGQATNPNAPPPFQFGSPSAQPGSGGFSMGSGPSTPQRSRTLQPRRRRI